MVPPVDLSPATRIDTLARCLGRRVAVIYEGGTYSYPVLAGYARRLAAVLAEGGARPGDRVLYLGGNSVTFLTTFLAAVWLKAVFVPVNSRLTAPEIGTILDDCAPHTLVVEPGHRGIAEAAVGSRESRMLLVPGDPGVHVDEIPPAPWELLSDSLDTIGPEPLPCDQDTPAMLAYTSGTTGRPKGVELTHGNLWWNGANMDPVAPVLPNDITLVVAPLFHTAPFGCFTLRTLMRAGTVVLRREFEAARMLADLVTYRVSTVFAVPAMFAAVAAEAGFPDADLTALRTAVTAGAPAPAPLIDQYLVRGIALQHAYGLTETLFVSCLPVEHPDADASSAGLALPYTGIRIVDPIGGTQVEPGERGEVWVRAPTMSPGYRNNAEATAAAFTSGWFRTGDIGYLDRRGYLYLVDRLKDMIIVGGDNVYSAEVEQVLARCPGIMDVAVVGAPDPHEGECVVAVVSGGDDPGPSLAQLRRFAEGDLARYKLPTRVVHAERIPRNAMGKIDKVAIRAALIAGDDTVFARTDAESPTAPVDSTPLPTPSMPVWLRTLGSLSPDEQFRIVFDTLSDAVGWTIRAAPRTLDPGDRLQDIGLSSLAAVELARRLNATFALDLPSTALFDHQTVGELANDLRERIVSRTARPTVLERLAEFEQELATIVPDPAVHAELRIRLRTSLHRLTTAAADTPRSTDLTTATDTALFALLDTELGKGQDHDR